MPVGRGRDARQACPGRLTDIDREPSAWSVIAMLRIAIFVTLLLMALAYALRKGGGPEKAMAAILIVMALADQARKSVVSGKSVSVRVDLGGRRILKKKNRNQNSTT